MKKFFAIILAATLLFCAAGCSLFSDDSTVQFEELYTHKDPDGLKYDERKVLINKDFGTLAEEIVSSAAYPDTFVYGDDGIPVGSYDYDPATGLATGWIEYATGEFHEDAQDLGMPDEDLMITFSGNITLGAVIYGNEGTTVASYLYAFLSDTSDKDAVVTVLSENYGFEMTSESDTVLCCAQVEASVSAQFEFWQEQYGQIQSDRSASGYAENLKMELGLKNYGVNPYKPCSEAKDPEDVEFDEKRVLTSSGAYSFVDESFEKDMVGRTDVVYGLEGKAVAHVIYYEYKTKDAADKLMASTGNSFGTLERVSDTIVKDGVKGQELKDIINSYIGYSVLTDDSFEGYATNVEDSYLMMVYEQ